MIVYHGTSKSGAKSILSDGISIQASSGGYFGFAFYVAEDAKQVGTLAQLGDDEDSPLIILSARLDSYATRALDLCNSDSDWDYWQSISDHGRKISNPKFHEFAVKCGIGAVRDINSMGGWAVYDPSLITEIRRME